MRALVCPSLMIACCLAGCLAKSNPLGTNGGLAKEKSISQSLPGTVGPANRPGVSPTSALPSTPAPAIAPIIANNSGSLIGVVKVPASIIANNSGSIIANNSGSIIANNSGSIIANNSGSYRLLSTIEQKPVAGITVHLCDAGGNPITDKDGKPMVAVTDDKGQYTFKGFVPARNLVLKVQLSESLGQLQAIVAKSSEEKRVVDMDLVSTLVTGYILDQYVKGQTDPQVTLDKLPKDVEKDTRVKATSALDSGVSVPDSLTTTEVVKTVTAMRQKNSTFNEQMELVKRLLIAAGQSDMGSGRLATEVSVGGVKCLEFGPDGALYISASADHRVWRLGANGRIETAAGSGTLDPGSLTGKKAAEAGYSFLTKGTFDSKGRLVVLEAPVSTYPLSRLSRVEADGTVTELAHDSGAHMVLPGAGDDLWLFVGNMMNNASELYTMGADKVPRLQHTFTDQETDVIRSVLAGGRDAQGRLYIGSDSWATVNGATEGPAVYRFDPATKTMNRVLGKIANNLKGLSLDPNGNVFYVDAAGKLLVLKPDGSTIKLLDALPDKMYVDLDLPSNVAQVLLGPDGAAYLGQGSLVYKIQNGQPPTLIAGVTATTGGQAKDLALLSPSGVAVSSNGTMFVGDEGLHQIVQIKSDNSVSVFAGTGENGFSGDGGLAINAKIGRPLAVGIDAAGNVYFAEGEGYSAYRVRKIGTDGKITTLHKADGDIEDLVVAADGTVYYRSFKSLGFFMDESEIYRIAPDGTVTMVVTKDDGLTQAESLALGPDGALYMGDSNDIFKWTKEQGFKVFKEKYPLNREGDSNLAIDSKGRFYVSDIYADTILRWDPATDAVTVIAGEGGVIFTGTGVDDSIVDPSFIRFDSAGNLYISDTGHKQIKRIPADKLK